MNVYVKLCVFVFTIYIAVSIQDNNPSKLPHLIFERYCISSYNKRFTYLRFAFKMWLYGTEIINRRTSEVALEMFMPTFTKSSNPAAYEYCFNVYNWLRPHWITWSIFCLHGAAILNIVAWDWIPLKSIISKQSWGQTLLSGCQLFQTMQWPVDN